MASYLANTTPFPPADRVPWYRYTAPCYAGIFLWVGFYQMLAQGTIDRAGMATLLPALVVAGVLSYALFYHVPAMLGWKTGYPLGVIGSSTFGSKGSRLVPGLLMGIVQTAWLGAATFFGAKLTLTGLGLSARPGTLPFAVVAVVWGCAMALAGMKGIRFVARLALISNVIVLLAVLAVFLMARDGLQFHRVGQPEPLPAFLLLVQMVTAFFATAGAAAPEFGLRSRSVRDVVLGGLAGVVLPIIYAGGLAILTVTGARALEPAMQDYGYVIAVESLRPSFGAWISLLLAVNCIPAGSFFALIACNNCTVVLPGVHRLRCVMAGAAAAIVFAATGLPENLLALITVSGALFAPICGAMAADYARAQMKWPRTRPGVNYAGYGAWALGFLVAILPLLLENETLRIAAQPAAVYGFVTAFMAYILLSNIGLEPYRKRVRRRKGMHS